MLRHYRVKQVVHGIAHITGGGLEENLARIVPPSIQIQIKRGSWEMPPVFGWLQKLGDINSRNGSSFQYGAWYGVIVSPHFVESMAPTSRARNTVLERLGSACSAERADQQVVLTEGGNLRGQERYVLMNKEWGVVDEVFTVWG